MEPKVLHEEIIERSGPLVRLRRYLLGWWPELGTLHWGLQGQETIVEVNIVRPHRRFAVA